jgi:POT family proton-dependent oligopeptide transporter
MNEALPTRTRSETQPKAMIPLCTTEMWERFGFYIVQGMLIFLITNYFKLSQSQGILITGEYGALVYISPILGGYFADNYLGFRYSVLIGAYFQCLGYIFIATLSYSLMFWGLACVILGNGFLKPNIASYLGEFYKNNDPRRQAGFTYYYMIMNLGTFISTLTAGFIQRAWGWHACFGIAAVGMIIGIIIFRSNFKSFGDKGLPVRPDLIKGKRVIFVCATLLACAAVVIICQFLLRHAAIGNSILLVIAGILFLYLIMLTLKFKAQERRNMIALIWLILFAIVFWAIFFEIFSVVNLFVEHSVNRNIFGISVPAIAFISLESVFIVILGIPLAMLWKYLHHKKRDPNIAIKFALSIFALALAMWLLTYAINDHNAQFLVVPGWMVLFYLLLTLGEMLLSPNILAAVTELSPRKVVGLMMGVQYVAIGFGSSITGIIGQFAAIPQGETNPILTNAIYSHAFSIYAYICLGTGVLVLISSPFIKRLITPLYQL